MIGIVVIGHGRLAKEMIQTAEFVAGPMEKVQALEMNPDLPQEKLENQIREAIKQVDGGEGVLILTDMFGGTPSNLSLSFLEAGKVEVISGVNLPMLLKLFGEREGIDLHQYAQEIKASGQRHISLASEILEIPLKSGKK